MKARDTLIAIRSHYKTATALAEALGVSTQRLNGWMNGPKGIGGDGRVRIWMLANKHGAKLPRNWLLGEQTVRKQK